MKGLALGFGWHKDSFRAADIDGEKGFWSKKQRDVFIYLFSVHEPTAQQTIFNEVILNSNATELMPSVVVNGADLKFRCLTPLHEIL